MAEELIALASQFSQRMGGGVPVTVCAEPMGPGEEGFSGGKAAAPALYVCRWGRGHLHRQAHHLAGAGGDANLHRPGAGLYPSRLGHPGNPPRRTPGSCWRTSAPASPCPRTLWPGRPRWPKRWPPLHGDNLSRPGSPACSPPAQEGHWQRVTHSPFPGPPPAPVPAGRGVLPALRQPSASAVQAGGSALSGRCWPSARRKPPSP